MSTPVRTTYLPDEEAFQQGIKRRNQIGAVWRTLFFMAIIIALIALTALFYNIAREAFGVVAENFRNNPDTLAERWITVERDYAGLSDEDKLAVAEHFFEGQPDWLRLLTAEYVLGVDLENREAVLETVNQTFGELLDEGQYPAELENVRFGDFTQDITPTVAQYLNVLYTNLGSEGFDAFMREEVDGHTFSTEIGEIGEVRLNALTTEVYGEVPSPPIPFEELTTDQLSIIATQSFEANPARLRILVLDWVLGVTLDDGADRLRNVSDQTVGELLEPGQYPERLRNKPIGNPPLASEDYQEILFMNLDEQQLRDFVQAEVAQLQVARSWPLNEVVLDYNSIEQELETNPDLEGAELKFYSWVNLDFLTQPMNSRPELAGIRTALLGSIWMILMTMLFAFPLGIGAAIYLEEYAENNRLNRLIQTNIYNLSGVPSIIYGILGLAVFVRALEVLTSGEVFGFGDPTTANGRTLISASLTMSLLILPILIINAQEAIRAVPNSLRQASFGLGATQWQTIWNHVLPYALPGILTGTILAVSRAIGETAPMIVVGAATYITINPDSPFSKFTVLPIQIYRWTVEPEPEFRDASAAAIVVLLIILLSLNSVAIILRNRFSRSR
ncbi:MAG: phosphate ABC transporter permease PstA [Anaerolineales bacterium]